MSEADGPIGLGDLTDLADGEMRCFEQVGRDGIVVCRVGSELFALTDNCSHADTPLSEGRLLGYGVTCPLHGASFDVRTGEHSGPPAWEGVPCHAVTEVDGIAMVVLSNPTRDTGPSADGSHMQTR
ncbi:Rieske 2Fe-2S domain-containing protein [Ilumatobacter sp.]|uniref:Rieske 2Fe-2S domain-containing protein n=1 Tax=Ilumatobacter sp. TaxID=1967498 RepID=UPI0037504E6C